MAATTVRMHQPKVQFLIARLFLFPTLAAVLPRPALATVEREPSFTKRRALESCLAPVRESRTSSSSPTIRARIAQESSFSLSPCNPLPCVRECASCGSGPARAIGDHGFIPRTDSTPQARPLRSAIQCYLPFLVASFLRIPHETCIGCTNGPLAAHFS